MNHAYVRSNLCRLGWRPGMILAAALCWMLPPSTAYSQSLWMARTSSERSLISDPVARQVGDILTILVQEKQRVQDDGKVELSKDVALDSKIQVFDIKPNTFNTLPALKKPLSR